MVVKSLLKASYKRFLVHLHRLMSIQSTKILEVCNSRYQEIYGAYHSISRRKVWVSHFGEFSQDLVNSITSDVEQGMIEAGEKKATVKRMFSILVEGLQNVRLHGEKDEDGNQYSFLVIAQEADNYLVTFGNLMLNLHIPLMDTRLRQINSYGESQVKDLYMEVLTNGIISHKGGAGLGFITMAMKSKNKLSYNFEQVNDRLSCFTVEVKVDRRGS